MNFKETLEKVESSEEYKELVEKNPDLELCAGFFILDFLSNDNKSSVDYKIGDKVFTFEVDDKISLKEDKLMDLPNTPKLEKIKPETKIEVDELKGIAGNEALDNGIEAKFHKIIAVLQTYEPENNKLQVWNLTCMLDKLIILHLLVDCNTGKIIKFERRSMMDLIKKK